MECASRIEKQRGAESQVAAHQMARATTFAITGLLFASNSLVLAIADPNYQRPVTVADWFTSLSFSAAALALAASLPILGAYADGQLPWITARIGAVGAAIVAIANILEDPLRQESAFFGFLGGVVALHVGLLGLTLALTRIGDRRKWLLAVAPATVFLDLLLLHPLGGGVLVVVAFLIAAGVAVESTRETTASPPG
jgi:hypothetical protein